VAVAVFLLMALLLSSLAALSLPNELTLQGKLTNTAGVPTAGTYNMSFKIYDSFTSGNVLYQSTMNVTTDANGVYDVILRNVNLNFSGQYYLGITVGTDNESTPRINLTSSPYSFRSNVSEGLNPQNAYTLAQLTVTGDATIGSNTSTFQVTSLGTNITAAGNLAIAGNATIGQRLSFMFNNIIENFATGFLRLTGNVIVTNNLTIGDNALFVDANNTRVGIGTGTPLDTLTVLGNISASTRINASSIGAADVLQVRGQDVQVEGVGFKSANFTSLYDARTDRFGNENATALLNNETVIRSTALRNALSNNTDATLRNLSISNLLELGWANLTNYPAGCSAGQAVTAIGDTLTCVDISSSSSSAGGWNNDSDNTYTSRNVVVDTTVFLVNTSLNRVGVNIATPGAALEVIGDIKSSGQLNVTSINATSSITVRGGEVQVEGAAFKAANFTSLYDGRTDRFGVANFTALYGTEYSSTGYKEANLSADLAAGVASSIVTTTITSDTIIVNKNLYVIGNISNTNVANLNVNGSLYPALDDLFSLGNGSLRWKNANFTGTLQAGTVSATTLTDGTATITGGVVNAPTIQMSGSIVQVEANAFKISNLTGFLGVSNASIIRTENLSTVVRTADAFNFANNLSAILDNNTIVRAGNLSTVVRTADAFNAANFTSNFATHNATSGVWNGTATAIYPRSITANVGIGTDTPDTSIDILSSSQNVASIKINHTVANSQGANIMFIGDTLRRADWGLGGSTYTQTAIANRTFISSTTASGISFIGSGTSDIRFYSSTSSETMRLTSGGFLGLGTGGPSRTFHINGTGNSGGLVVTNASGQPRFIVNTINGFVGIGTTAPGTQFHVIGNVNISDSLNVSGTVQAARFVGDGSLLTGVPESFVYSSSNITDYLGGAGANDSLVRAGNLSTVVRTADAFNFANNLSAILDNNTIVRAGNLSTVVRTADAFNAANFTSNFATHNATSGVWNASSTAVFLRDVAKRIGIGTIVPTSLLYINDTQDVLATFVIQRNDSATPTLFINASSQVAQLRGQNIQTEESAFKNANATALGFQYETPAFKLLNLTNFLGGAGANDSLVRAGNLSTVVRTADAFNAANFTTLYDGRTDRFGVGNYSTEYGSTGFKIANYSAEYGSTGFKVANFTSNFATHNATSGVWNGTATAIYPRSITANVGIGTENATEKLTVAGGNILQRSTSSPVLLANISSPLLDGARSVFVFGKYAYMTGVWGDTFVIIDISNPRSPEIVGNITDTRLNLADDVYVSGKYAYVVGGPAGATDNRFSIVDVSNVSLPKVVSSISDATFLDDPSEVFVSGKYAYVTAEEDNMLTIVDISNPNAPSITGSISDTGSLGSPQGVYVQGMYAYVAASGNDSLTIIDVSNPTSPSITANISSTALDNTQAVYVSGRYAYLTAVNSDALIIVDIANATKPKITSTLTSSTFFDGARDIEVSGDYAYITASNIDTLTVVDVSNVSSPFVSASLSDQAMDGPIGVDIAGKYAYVASATSKSLTILDISGVKVPTATIGNIWTSDLSVVDSVAVGNNVNIHNALGVGAGGIKSDGDITTTNSLTALGNLKINNTVFFVNATSGNVGIGTTSPAEKLVVIGKVNISASLNVSGTVQAARFVGDGSLLTGVPESFVYSNSNITDYLGGAGANDTLIRSTNTTFFSLFAKVSDAFNLGNLTNYFGDSSFNASVIRSTNTSWFNTNFNSQLSTVNSSISLWNGTSTAIYPRSITASVGIGTATPSKLLVVNGTTNAITFDPSATIGPVMNTTGQNITITSATGSVIIRLG
jgi:tRNA G18 (ribose-2'-O)-methylase SpoU